jgi:hypothetical protein
MARLGGTSRVGIGLALLLALAAPAFAATWVPGHYGPGGAWRPGHWVGRPDVWIVGHYGPGGVWIPGHWAGRYGPPPGVYEAPPGPARVGFHWVPGFYDRGGYWHAGHWAPN